MTLSLSSLRDMVEANLRDASNLTWSTDQVDRAIQLALEEFGRVSPREAQTTVQPTAARVIPLDTELSASDWGLLVDVVGVEFPAGDWPPTYVEFTRHGANLTLHVDTAPSGTEDAIVYFTTLYLMDSTPSSNVPEGAAQLLVQGAAGHALLQLAAARSETLNVAGDAVAGTLRRQGEDRLATFRELLRRHHGRKVTSGRFYRPDDQIVGRHIVQPPGGTW